MRCPTMVPVKLFRHHEVQRATVIEQRKTRTLARFDQKAALSAWTNRTPVMGVLKVAAIPAAVPLATKVRSCVARLKNWASRIFSAVVLDMQPVLTRAVNARVR